MIYFMRYNRSKPKRIDADYALDFYQMWYGNEIGQLKYAEGMEVNMPDMPNFTLWGEDIPSSVWFKKILNGEVEDGYVQFDGTFSGTVESWQTI